MFTNNRHTVSFAATIALIIYGGVVLLTRFLVNQLNKEEGLKMELVMSAIDTYQTSSSEQDLSLVLQVLQSNNSVPIAVVDSQNNIIFHHNISLKSDSISCLKSFISTAYKNHTYKKIHLDNSTTLMLCYAQSKILWILSLYPYLLILLSLLFILTVFYFIYESNQAEKNKLWAGLSLETAHQLGTPLSSLDAWLNVMKEQYPSSSELKYAQDDIDRIKMVTDRFSKIGSKPKFETIDLNIFVKEQLTYLQKRLPSSVDVSMSLPDHTIYINGSVTLLSWVFENLIKNATDAMSGVGRVAVSLYDSPKEAIVEVKDSGKGIRKSDVSKVFVPGFTTKSRGWGLGLSLSKRIVEDYHNGKIYVKQTKFNEGTIFRIEIKKQIFQ